ncbi:MAG: hypothetical protein BRC25_01575 [Parcubacteria group bacterium SW_6_46_9]|nr:MAG: hypothetical protein BRC25_01575 [Parcubacteria group bacterium SW_6_46_9]
MNILVLEDSHPEPAIEAVQNVSEVAVRKATTLAEALSFLKKGEVDGAIFDIFVPLGETEDPFTRKYRQNMLRAVKSQRHASRLTCTLHEYVEPLRRAMLPRARERPFGVVAAEKADENGVPFVLATSVDHHDQGAVGKICVYQRMKGWPEMIDRMDKSDPENWEPAVDRLMELIH